MTNAARCSTKTSTEAMSSGEGISPLSLRKHWCPGRDLNPHFPCEKKDFKSFASADFATRALPSHDNRPVRCSLARSANAMIVNVGF
jgi:hypothetical protein